MQVIEVIRPADQKAGPDHRNHQWDNGPSDSDFGRDRRKVTVLPFVPTIWQNTCRLRRLCREPVKPSLKFMMWTRPDRSGPKTMTVRTIGHPNRGEGCCLGPWAV